MATIFKCQYYCIKRFWRITKTRQLSLIHLLNLRLVQIRMTFVLVTLSKFTHYKNLWMSKKPNKTQTIDIPQDGIILLPQRLYLASTIEAIGSDHFIAMYEGRSSMARLGIQSHISAGFGDVGFKSRWTLEITVIHPVKVYPGMRIGQIYFHRINSKANEPQHRYHGKYTNQSDPQESKSYLD